MTSATMKGYSALLVLALGLSLLASARAANCKSTYTVQGGDTLSKIANAQHTTLKALEAANPSITDPNKIQAGQKLCIPGSGSGSGSSPAGSLYSGSGSATYYYDVKTHCPQDPNGYPETNGYPTCTSFTAGPHQQTLKQLNSNNVVAIDMNVLKNNRAGLCGKEITVLHNGVKVSPPDGGSFFVWDGCAACVGGVRLDFSVSAARLIQSNICDAGVAPGISWSVSDTQVQPFIA